MNFAKFIRTTFPQSASGRLLLSLLHWCTLKFRSSRPEVFCKMVFFKISQNSQENTCARVSFLIKLQAKIFKNTYFYRTTLVASSENFCLWGKVRAQIQNLIISHEWVSFFLLVVQKEHCLTLDWAKYCLTFLERRQKWVWEINISGFAR